MFGAPPNSCMCSFSTMPWPWAHHQWQSCRIISTGALHGQWHTCPMTLFQETLESLSSLNLRKIHPDLHQRPQILSYLLSENVRIHIVTVSYQNKMQYYMNEQDLVLLPCSERGMISKSKHDTWSCGRTDLLPLQKGVLKMIEKSFSYISMRIVFNLYWNPQCRKGS